MSVKSFAEAVKEGVTRYTRGFGIEQAEAEEVEFATKTELAVVSEAAVNPVTYGAKVDGSTDDSAAWAAAIAVIASTGGDIIMPPGKSIVASGLNLEGLRNVNVSGQGSAEGGSGIRTNRTDGGFLVNAKKSIGISFSNMELFHAGPSGTAAVLLDARGTLAEETNFLQLLNCLVVANTSATSKVKLLACAEGISQYFRSCQFTGGERAICGREKTTEFVNGLEIDACSFSGQALAPLLNLGEATEIHGGTVFEPTASGEPLILLQEAGFELLGFDFHGCESADSSKTTGVSMILNGVAIHIHGNLFSTGPGEGTKKCIQLNGKTEGLSIQANALQNYLLGIDKNGQTTAAVGIGPNVYQTVGTDHNFAASNTPYVEPGIREVVEAGEGVLSAGKATITAAAATTSSLIIVTSLSGTVIGVGVKERKAGEFVVEATATSSDKFTWAILA